MSAKARWIRLSVDWDDSDWVDELSDSAQLAWIKLLCHAKREGAGRHKIVTPKVAARKWRITDHNAVMEMITAAIADGAIIEEDGWWVLANWDSYQKPDATNTERQRRFRHKLNLDNAVMDDDNAVTLSRATETETETLTTSSEVVGASAPKSSKGESSPRMVKPQPEEVAAYFKVQNSSGSEARKFWDYYTANGWKVGKNPMKDWQAAARGWIARANEHSARGPTEPMYSKQMARVALDRVLASKRRQHEAEVARQEAVSGRN